MVERLETRRNILRYGCAVTCAGIPTSVWAADPACPDGDAFGPWCAWDHPDLPTSSRIVLAATLAASAHNTQPWRFRIASDRIELHADALRRLPTIDPAARELRMSLGCALENMAITARAAGLLIRVAVADNPTDRFTDEPTATLFFDGKATPMVGLTPFIAHRHTNRGPYDATVPVPITPFIAAAEDSAFTALRLMMLTDKRQRSLFSTAIVRATEAIVADGPMVADSDAWFRGDAGAIARHRDGLTLAGAGLSPFMEWIARRLPDLPAERVHRAWIDRTRGVQTAGPPIYGLILANDPDSTAHAVAAGRLWQRLHLIAAASGFAAQPLNPITEISERRRSLGQSPLPLDLPAGADDQSLVFAFRIGFPLRPAPASPRRPPDIMT